MEINQAIEDLRTAKIISLRSQEGLSFGKREQCRAIFEDVFKAFDTTVVSYNHLPEYESIIDWMVDTKGKGLLLTGSCGRGKSIIITGVIPVLFLHRLNKILRPFHADLIPTKVDEISRLWAIAIDELGVEPQVNNYGEKSEGFNTIINAAELRLAPMFISTNLTSAEILARYGERTLDRICRLCKVVKFSGDSFRK
jgi:DNA replication protein DnaC